MHCSSKNSMLSIIITGFTSSIVQIIAIGAQNTFILKCGLTRSHIFLACLVCVVCDIMLITLSIFGVAQILSSNVAIMRSLQIGGVLFLSYLGAKSLIDAFRGDKKFDSIKGSTISRKKAFITALCVSLLNPHALVDTIVIIGSISSQYIEISEKIYFYIGSIFSSIIWFFLLGYASKALIPLFQKPICWKILDTIIGITMFILAYQLLI
jgi:L-lysine exporter family protein LysE/ArgO